MEAEWLLKHLDESVREYAELRARMASIPATPGTLAEGDSAHGAFEGDMSALVHQLRMDADDALKAIDEALGVNTAQGSASVGTPARL